MAVRVQKLRLPRIILDSEKIIYVMKIRNLAKPLPVKIFFKLIRVCYSRSLQRNVNLC